MVTARTAPACREPLCKLEKGRWPFGYNHRLDSDSPTRRPCTVHNLRNHVWGPQWYTAVDFSFVTTDVCSNRKCRQVKREK